MNSRSTIDPGATSAGQASPVVVPQNPSTVHDSLPSTDTVTASLPGSRWRWHWSLAIAFLLISILYLNRGTIWLFAISDTIGNFRWQIVFLCTGLAVYQWWKCRPVWSAIILSLVALPVLQMAALYLPGNQPPEGRKTLRILTLNVQEPNDDYERVSRLIADTNADVVNLMEFSPTWALGLRDALKGYPERIGPVNGNVIYSRIPLEPWRSNHPFYDPVEYLTATAKLEFDGQPVMIMVTHPSSPISLDRLLERDAQIAILAAPVAQFADWHHVVVTGDFNATTRCRSLRTFLDITGFRDTRQGFGLQSSWPTWFWPGAICIDHSFVSEGVHVHHRATGPNAGSDHLPFVLDVSFDRHKRFLREETPPGSSGND